MHAVPETNELDVRNRGFGLTIETKTPLTRIDRAPQVVLGSILAWSYLTDPEG